MSDVVLEVEGLEVAFPSRTGPVTVVQDVSFRAHAGRTLGIVGESGSGKTVTSLAVMGLVPLLGGRATGSVRLRGEELLGLDDRSWRDLRANRIAMVFQQAIRSLNPAYTVGDQIAEVIRRHRDVSRREAWSRAVDLLDRVHIPDAARRAHDHPHALSGGMCQRVMIAMALSCEPEVLIADEPTTALDVTVQARVLDLLRELQADTGVAILFVSHDLGVIAEMCDEVVVMYAGQVVEQAHVDDLLVRPRHPYTAGLLASIPGATDGDRLHAIRGQVPPPDDLPSGCRFAPRCDHVVAGRCDTAPVELRVGPVGADRCVRTGELLLPGVTP